VTSPSLFVAFSEQFIVLFYLENNANSKGPFSKILFSKKGPFSKMLFSKKGQFSKSPFSKKVLFSKGPFSKKSCTS